MSLVPGASTTPPERIAGLDLQGVRTVRVLLDADDAGRTRRSQSRPSVCTWATLVGRRSSPRIARQHHGGCLRADPCLHDR